MAEAKKPKYTLTLKFDNEKALADFISSQIYTDVELVNHSTPKPGRPKNSSLPS